MTTSASRRLLSLALLVLSLGMPSCGSFGTYVKNRALDLSDIVDIKAGGNWKDGYPVGAGLKVEVTEYVGLGLGVALIPHTREWYGRRSLISYDQQFHHFLIAGWDGSQQPFDAGADANDWYQVALPINLAAIDHPYLPPMLQRFRVGFELIVPLFLGGLYINVGEIGDFFAGIATADPAGDDGLSITDTYPEHFVESDRASAE